MRGGGTDMVESSKMRHLRIGIDVDGVIVDYVTASLPLLSEICGRPVSYQDFYSRNVGEVLNIDEKKETYFWEQVICSDLLRFAPPIKGAIAGLSKLDSHDIWIVTGRPTSMKSLTVSWLNENNIKYDRIVFDSDKTVGQLSVEQDCDVFVEDQLEVASVIAEAGIFTVLLDQPWNQTSVLAKNCIRVYDWNAIVMQISEFERV
jgi:uncharacterized HAD superfamily protein